MKRICNIFAFFGNGFRVFIVAAGGGYRNESEAIREMREEMFGNTLSDKQRMRQDMMMLGRDWRMAINKATGKNG